MLSMLKTVIENVFILYYFMNDFLPYNLKEISKRYGSTQAMSKVVFIQFMVVIRPKLVNIEILIYPKNMYKLSV